MTEIFGLLTQMDSKRKWIDYGDNISGAYDGDTIISWIATEKLPY